MNSNPLLLQRSSNRFAAWWSRYVNSKAFFLIAAFLLPIIINAIIFIIKGVYPFGDKSVLVLDLNGQYVYFFEAMRDVFQGTASPFYSWYRALGGEFSGIYAYYVASPFSFLSIFFPENGITEFLWVMTLLKVGSSGFTFAYYLYKSRPSKPLNMIIFSTCYALSSYAIVQANNTMWIDALIYLPIIMLGIENIVNRGRYMMYCGFLALCFIANFYIGWMVAIFSTLYFFYYYIAKYPMKNFERFFYAFYKWLIFSVVAAMIAAVIILPTYYSLQFGKSSFQNPSYAFEPKFDFIKVFTQMLPFSYDTVRPNGLPFIYSGMICLLLLPVYFATGKIKGREKISSGLILAVMVLSFTATTIDIFWHGLQKPNWLNYRYSFMFIFLVVVFAYEAFRHLTEKSYRTVLGVGGVIGVLLLVVQALPDEYFTIDRASGKAFQFISDKTYTIWVSIICLGLILAALWGVCKKKQGASVILCVIVCLELFANGIYDVYQLHDDVYYSSRTSYVTFMERWSGIVRSVQEQDDTLYRMEKTIHRKVNDNMALQMRGITHSTSTLNKSVINLLFKLGYASKSHWSRYVDGNVVNDSLLGIKYLISNKENAPSQYDLLLSEIDPTTFDAETPDMLYAYINKYALPMMYGVNENLLDYKLDDDYSAPDILDHIVSAMLGHDVDMYQVLVEGDSDFQYSGVEKRSAGLHRKWATTDGSTGTLYITFTVPKDGECYFHLPSAYPRDTLVRVKTVNSEGVSGNTISFSYLTNETHTMHCLGTFSEGDTVTLEVVLKDSGGSLYYYKDCGYVYYFDEEVFEEAFSELRESVVDITDFSDTKVSGTINAQEGDTLVFTSIPYDEGWTVKVDGKKVKLYEEETTDKDGTVHTSNKSLDSLLCFEVPEGEHTIELTFTPQGFKIGGIACIIGLGLWGWFGLKAYSERKKRKKRMLAVLRAPGAPFGPALPAAVEPSEAPVKAPVKAPVEETQAENTEEAPPEDQNPDA